MMVADGRSPFHHHDCVLILVVAYSCCLFVHDSHRRKSVNLTLAIGLLLVSNLQANDDCLETTRSDFRADREHGVAIWLWS